MTIKRKLSLGLGVLFTVIVVLGSLGTYYLHRLSNESKAIIQANYESLVYAKNMRKALDEMGIDRASSLLAFEKNLKAQEGNVTETQEREITTEISNEYKNLRIDSLRSDQAMLLHQKLQQLMDVNLQAILRKNTLAQKTFETAILYMSLIASITILLSFSFVVNFPGYIADPIRILAESIREVANKNYSQRIFIRSEDEFGELALAFNTMAQKLDEYEHSNLAQLIFQKKRIETIINTMHDPILGMDEHQCILFANQDALALLKERETQLIGRYAPDVALTNDVLRSMLQEDTEHKPLKLPANGKDAFFTKETLDIRIEEQLIGKVVVLKNITVFKELDSAKTQFIATISHELKTPIASIKMGLQLLEDDRIGTTNEEQKKLLSGIREDSQRLLKITGELLDLTQVESGKIELVKAPTNLQEVVHYAVESLRFQAEQKQLAFQLFIGDDLPWPLIDKEKTTWVVINLLSNAIRYSPRGAEVVITVQKEKSAVCISVQDVGKGIDAAYQERIFEKYFKVPEEGNRSGTGLGLAISKEFIEAQGGQILLASEVGKGCTFSLLFPV